MKETSNCWTSRSSFRRVRSGKQHQGTVTKRMEDDSSLNMEKKDSELERISGHFMTPQMLLRDFVEPETSKRLLPIKYKTLFMWQLSRLLTWITEGSCVPAFFINKAIDPQSWPGAAQCLLSFAVMNLYILVESPKSWANTQSATRGLV